MNFLSLAAASLAGIIVANGVGASSTSSSTSSSSSDASSSSCDANPIEAEVTIVGGGLAGMFAALVLDQADVSYNLLESNDYWGGRLRSFEPSSFGGLVLEEGAQFMYGKNRSQFRQNPIWKLFDNFGMEVFDYTLSNVTAYTKDGEKIDDDSVQKLIKKINRSVRKCLDVAGEEWIEEWINDNESPDASAETTLKNCLPKKFRWINNSPLKTAISHIYAGEIENQLPLDEVSKASFPDDSVYQYGQDLFIQYGQEGSTSIMTALVNKLDDESVHLNAKVTSVKDFDSGASRVKTIAEIDGCKQKFRSDYIILTVPMSILKGASSSNVISFDPPLQHLNDHPIELNKVEKVWIKFSECFWDDSSQWIVVTNELEGGASTLFFNYNKIFPGNNILLTFVREEAQQNMGGTGTIVVDTVIRDLKNLPGWHSGIAYESEVTRWQDDPNFAGAWEIWKLGKTIGAFQDFALPQGNLHKAGAGLCLNLWGFTWGAVLSGVAQAEWVAGRIEEPGVPAKKLEPWSPCSYLDDVTNKQFKAFYDKYDPLFEPS